MTTEEKEKLRAKKNEFIEKYRELATRYGLYVGACGCCDSPWVTDIGPSSKLELDDHIKHLQEGDMIG